MDHTILGRTGLKVTVMGIGCGGPSRVGQSTGRTEAESVTIVRQALDAGVNFIDTSERYGTEKVVGKAIRGIDRGSLVLSTKKGTRERMTAFDEHSVNPPLAYPAMPVSPEDRVGYSPEIEAGRLDMREVLEPIYQRASEALGRDFPYPGDED